MNLYYLCTYAHTVANYGPAHLPLTHAYLSQYFSLGVVCIPSVASLQQILHNAAERANMFCTKIS